MTPDSASTLDLAVVGLAGRFPGAPSVDAFWRRLRAGDECIRDLDEDELRAAGVSARWLRNPAYVLRAADIADVDRFDARLFRFTPREAELTDPQFRVFLEDVWTALESAGLLGEGHELRVGVFAGSSPSTYYSSCLATTPDAAQALGAQASLGNTPDYLATQVSYRLDLRGPSLTVQTACSTSLVAIHWAAQSLLNHECDVAVAGGVSITVPQTTGYLYEEGDIASPDGRCRAFDANASGTLKGNGSAVVVLRRREDAERDGDTILAIVRGSALNNDGSAKIGFTAPSVDGQAAVISEALAAADVDPETIGYVEAHGTATPLGDPIEVAALTQAFGGSGRSGSKCALGSVKTNVGHLDAAAGATGFLKTVLSLRHRELVPSLHYRTPNPKIDFEGSPFFVNTSLRPFEAIGEAPRRAGVSSFGIGGTNAHVVLEESPEAPRAPSTRGRQTLVLSAATETALGTATSNLADHLEAHPDLDLADVAHTLQVGRKRLPWRRSLVVADVREAVTALRTPATGAQAPAHDERRGSRVAFLFPGQGAQYAGMVRTLAKEESRFRAVLDRCVDELTPRLGVDLRDLLMAAPDDAAANERLRDTALAQPALFVVERALAELWMSCGISPTAMAGHSIGEYVAAQLAGVFSLEDALRVVAERGRLMGSCPRGVMIAVPLSEAAVRARLAAHPGCALAVINGPAAVVVAGPEEDVARFETDLARDDIASRRLHTSHAFHSAMMDPILSEFEACLRTATLRAPEIPFVSNVTGTWITAERATSPRYWVDQLRGTVRFADDLAVLTEDPDRVLLEVGPGRTLSSAVRSVSPRATAIPSLPGATSGEDDARSFGEALGRLWAAGVDVDWRATHNPDAPGRIPLPTYPFERERAWVEPGAVATEPRGNEKNPDLSQWFWVPTWKRIRSVPRVRVDDSPWLVIGEDSGLAEELARCGEARGVRVFRARPAASAARAGDTVFDLDPTNDTHWLDVLNVLAAEGALPGRVIHLSCYEEDVASPVERGFHSLVSWWKAAGHHHSGEGIRFVVATRHLFDVTGESAAGPERAALIGFCRVAPQELPGTTCRLVDVANEAPADVARMLEAEMDAADTEPVVARRGGHRWAPAYESVRTDAAAEDVPGVRRDGVYVVTGGAGELEAELSRRLAAAGARSITWLSARGPTADLDLRGTEFVARDIAVTDSAALADALRVLRDRYGKIDAVFHTAGEIGGGMLQRQNRADADRILGPRLAAGDVARHLREGERLVNVSSTISATGVFGQSDYCAGSTYLEALALARRDGNPDIVTVGFGMTFWDRWTAAAGGGGDALLEELHAIREEIGITIEEGVEALWRALTLREPVVLVSPQDLDELVAESRAASMSDVLEGVGGVGGGAAAGSGDLRSDTERTVAAVWTELLGVPDVGRDDNFLELGGNSLLAIQLASRLRKTFDIDLAIASLFESQNLAQLAGAVDAALEERHASAEILRLLEEIEDLSEDEIRAELERGIDAGAGE